MRGKQQVRIKSSALFEIKHLHTGKVNYTYSLAFSPDEEYLAVGALHKVHLYHVRSGELVEELGGWESEIAQHIVFSDGDLVVNWSHGVVEKYRQGKLYSRIELPDSYGKRAVLSSDGKIVAVNKSYAVTFLDTDSGTQVGEIVRYVERWSEMHFSPDNKKLAILRYGRGVEVYSVPQGDELLWKEDLDAFRISISPDGQYLVLGKSNGKVEIARLEDGKTVEESEKILGWITSVAVSPDLLVACADTTGALVLLTLKLSRIGMILESPPGPGLHYCYCMAFSPKGNYLATGGLSGIVYWYRYARRL